MKQLKSYIICLIILCTSITGCKKFVELDPPKTLLNTQNVFTSDDNASAAITGIYAQMVDVEFMPYLISVECGVAADELKNYSTINMPIYQNVTQAADSYTNLIWTAGYNYIYQANAVYEGCSKSTSLTASVKSQLMGEALFIRSFWLFYLVNLYGDVPLITTTDYKMNATAARTSKDLVYKQIIADLKTAQNNLNQNYVGSNSLSTSSDRVRPNQSAATALLARVYLYTGDYANAEIQAATIINNTSVYSTSTVNVNSVFLKNSKEAIWQLMKPTPNDNQINTIDGYFFILNDIPQVSFQNSTTISTQLMAAFDSTDQRKLNWIGKFTSAGTDYYYPFKYKVFNSATITECSTVLRVGEQYLIRAEARAQLGNLTGSIADLDVIRNRAGISLIGTVNPGISKINLLSTIMIERQKELFTEWGHRWLDLKRTGQIDAVMSAAAPLKGTSWNTNQQLWPLPQTEIGNDPNLLQNPGY